MTGGSSASQTSPERGLSIRGSGCLARRCTAGSDPSWCSSAKRIGGGALLLPLRQRHFDTHLVRVDQSRYRPAVQLCVRPGQAAQNRSMHLVPGQDHGAPARPAAEVCSRSCRQRAYERRKWRRPTAMVALAEDIATIKVRTMIRQEVWTFLREAGLVTDPKPPSPPRPRPQLRVVKPSDGEAPD
jgi:hypothetical protein